MSIRQDLALANGRITTPLIRNSGRVAGGFFSALGSWRDDDVVRYVAQLNPVLSGAKTQVTQATVAFYQQIARLSGQSFNRPVFTASALATEALRNGATTETIFRRPFVDMRRALANGSSMTDAIQAGAVRANQLAQTEIQLAKRNVGLAIRNANDGIVGYIRTLTGSENCALCYVASTQRYRRGDLLPIHPGCDCGEMPIYGSQDPGQIINEQRLEATHESVADRFGVSARDARALDYRNIMVADHGEMGPLLTWKSHNATTLANIAEKAIPGSSVTRYGPTVATAEIPEVAKSSLLDYQGEGYIYINKQLRGLADEPFPWIDEAVANLDPVFETTRTAKQVVVTRGFAGDVFGFSRTADIDPTPFVGQTFREKGYLSTSQSAGFTSYKYQLKLTVPEGTPAVDLNGVLGDASKFPAEQELLLNRGTKYKVTNVTRENDQWIVEAEVIP